MTARFYGTTTEEYEGQTLSLVLDMNAVCHFDAATGLNFFEVVGAWEKSGGMPPAGQLRALVHASMQARHPDMTVEDAGRLMSQDLTIFERLVTAATQGMQVSGKKPKAAATG